jgi:hypothetical protein
MVVWERIWTTKLQFTWRMKVLRETFYPPGLHGVTVAKNVGVEDPVNYQFQILFKKTTKRSKII